MIDLASILETATARPAGGEIPAPFIFEQGVTMRDKIPAAGGKS